MKLRIVSALSALVLSLGTSYAQAPPVEIVLPGGELGYRIEVTAFLEDSVGQPWSGCVRCALKDSGSGTEFGAEVEPDANGYIAVYTYAPLSAIAGPISFSVMADPQASALRGFYGPYLSAAEGVGAFRDRVPSGDSQNGFDADLGLCVLSPPPFVGSIQLTTPSPAGYELHLSDGDPDRFATSVLDSIPWSEALTTGTQSIGVYSWSRAGFWDFYFKNTDKRIVGIGRLRRGQDPVGFDVPPELNIEAKVDLNVFPTARRILVVQQADHMPNASSPIGSDVDFLAQSDRSVADGPPYIDSQGALRADLLSVIDDVIVEVWGWDLNDPSDQPELLSFSPLVSGAGYHPLQFN